MSSAEFIVYYQRRTRPGIISLPIFNRPFKRLCILKSGKEIRIKTERAYIFTIKETIGSFQLQKIRRRGHVRLLVSQNVSQEFSAFLLPAVNRLERACRKCAKSRWISVSILFKDPPVKIFFSSLIPSF